MNKENVLKRSERRREKSILRHFMRELRVKDPSKLKWLGQDLSCCSKRCSRAIPKPLGDPTTAESLLNYIGGQTDDVGAVGVRQAVGKETCQFEASQPFIVGQNEK